MGEPITNIKLEGRPTTCIRIHYDTKNYMDSYKKINPSLTYDDIILFLLGNQAPLPQEGSFTFTP